MIRSHLFPEHNLGGLCSGFCVRGLQNCNNFRVSLMLMTIVSWLFAFADLTTS